MLRYHKFTAGRFWVNEYGNAETTRNTSRFCHAYSPLHNVTPGVAYPPRSSPLPTPMIVWSRHTR